MFFSGAIVNGILNCKCVLLISLSATLLLVYRNATDFYIFLNIFLCLFISERETQRESGGGAEKEGDTESKAGSRLCAVSTEFYAGLELTNSKIMN